MRHILFSVFLLPLPPTLSVMIQNILVFFLSALVYGQQNCTKFTVRKEVHDMTQAEIAMFRETILKAHTTSDPDVPRFTIWENAAQIHNANAAITHNGAPFLFWHRMFLYTIEKKLQTINPNFFFPYWDTAVNDEYIDGRWQMSTAIRMTDLPQLNNRRSFQSENQVSPSEWSNLLQTSIRNREGFRYFAPSPQAELLHATLHVLVGGSMVNMIAPRDPLFYMHHGHIDYKWSQAQVEWAKNGLPQVGSPMRDSGNSAASTLNSPLPTYPRNIFADVLNMENLCVRYAAPGEVISTTTTTTTNQPTSTSVTNQPTTSSVTNGPSVTSVTNQPTTTSTSVSNQTTTTFVTNQTTTTSVINQPSTTSVSPTTSVSLTTSIIITHSTSSYNPGNTPGPYNPKDDKKDKKRCFKIPDSWLEMNNISKEDAEKGKKECETVKQKVEEGYKFPPIPVYTQEQYEKVIEAVIPKDITISPPEAPTYVSTSDAVTLKSFVQSYGVMSFIAVTMLI